MPPVPTEDERPDLYDGYDGIVRPKGWVNPVVTPPEIQKLIDERKKAEQGGTEAK